MSEDKTCQKVGYITDNDAARALVKEKKMWDQMLEKCRIGIEEKIRRGNAYIGRGHVRVSDGVKLAAFLLGKASENANLHDYDYTKDESIDVDVMSAVLALRISTIWNDLKSLLLEFPTEVFYTVAGSKEDNDPNATPDGIKNLVKEILEVKSNDKVVDLGCGKGKIAFDIKSAVSEAEVHAVDVNIDCLAVAKVINELSSNKIIIDNRDMFQLAFEDSMISSFDKVFSNYPFGVKVSSMPQGRDYIDNLRERIPAMSGATSSDWVYNALMMDILSEDGKAVGIMATGSAWNTLDIQIRKYFVENGYIECVISLPERLFPMMNMATSIIVMSHGNEGVRLVDASRFYCSNRLSGKRVNELSDDNISQILNAVKEDSEISQFIDRERLRNNEYVLSLSRYIDSLDKVEDGSAFKEIIKTITRGAPLKSAELDEITSTTPTNMQYLMISNVQNGFIDRELPYLKEISDKYKKYCLKDHCLILSKNGYPYKIAVAEITEGHQILANGNIYVIELDESKVDPYYVAAYLESEQGNAALKRITVGATIPNIGVEQLKEIIIPVPSKDKQRKIADNYKATKNEIEMLQIKLNKAKDRLTHVFDEDGTK